MKSFEASEKQMCPKNDVCLIRNQMTLEFFRNSVVVCFSDKITTGEVDELHMCSLSSFAAFYLFGMFPLLWSEF